MQKRKNVIIVVVALISGLIGTIIIMYYIQGLTSGSAITSLDSADRAYTQEETIDVVMAAGDIAQNTIITLDVVEIGSIPIDLAKGDGYKELDAVVGAMTMYPIRQGEQITDNSISRGEYASEFSYKVPHGKRAVSIEIAALSNLVAGFIQPGDKIDILASFLLPDIEIEKLEENNLIIDWSKELEYFQKVAQKFMDDYRMITFDGMNITFTVLENVEVLAIDKTIQRESIDDDTKTTEQENSDEPNTSSRGLITLALDVKQAEVITNLEMIGRIKLSLRNPGDESTVESKPMITR